MWRGWSERGIDLNPKSQPAWQVSGEGYVETFIHIRVFVVPRTTQIPSTFILQESGCTRLSLQGRPVNHSAVLDTKN